MCRSSLLFASSFLRLANVPRVVVVVCSHRLASPAGGGGRRSGRLDVSPGSSPRPLRHPRVDRLGAAAFRARVIVSPPVVAPRVRRLGRVHGRGLHARVPVRAPRPAHAPRRGMAPDVRGVPRGARREGPPRGDVRARARPEAPVRARGRRLPRAMARRVRVVAHARDVRVPRSDRRAVRAGRARRPGPAVARRERPPRGRRGRGGSFANADSTSSAAGG